MESQPEAKPRQPAATCDRRRDARMPCEGPVILRAVAPSARTIEAWLLDESAGGFRVTHNDRWLESGVVVEFEAPGRQGSARVMWTRRQNGVNESGLYILPARE